MNTISFFSDDYILVFNEKKACSIKNNHLYSRDLALVKSARTLYISFVVWKKWKL